MLSKRARGAALFVAAGLFLFSGCIFGTDEESEPTPPTPKFLPLTSKENVIYNLLQSYKYADIDKYIELLHPDYVWYNRQEDLISGAVSTPFFTRDEDIAHTEGLFKARLGIHEDPNLILESIELMIASTVWDSLPELNGSPCEDCWETERPYVLFVDMGTKIMFADNLVRFVVVPVIADGQKLYKLIQTYDISAN